MNKENSLLKKRLLQKRTERFNDEQREFSVKNETFVKGTE